MATTFWDIAGAAGTGVAAAADDYSNNDQAVASEDTSNDDAMPEWVPWAIGGVLLLGVVAVVAKS